jgi:CheY-like chemotaxis protein
VTAPLILNVNDHVAHLYMVSKMLRNAGFRVAEARTGAEALAKASADAPDVVVLDVRLPDASGFDVCRRLSRTRRRRTSRSFTRRRCSSARTTSSRGWKPAPMPI